MKTSEDLKKELEDLKNQFHARAQELGKIVAAEHVASLAMPPMVLQAKPKPEGKKLSPVPKLKTRKRTQSEDIETWSADKAARRVPTFVQQMTNGLKTKKEIVEKYGEGATFHRSEMNGAPAPLSAGM